MSDLLSPQEADEPWEHPDRNIELARGEWHWTIISLGFHLFGVLCGFVLIYAYFTFAKKDGGLGGLEIPLGIFFIILGGCGSILRLRMLLGQGPLVGANPDGVFGRSVPDSAFSLELEEFFIPWEEVSKYWALILNAQGLRSTGVIVFVFKDGTTKKISDSCLSHPAESIVEDLRNNAAFFDRISAEEALHRPLELTGIAQD